MSDRLLVVGGDAAGMSAAAEARRADPDRAITVLERGEDVAYAACGIPYWISGDVADIDDLVAHDAAYFRDRRRIDVRLDAEARAVDPDARTVTLADGEVLGYGALVMATGARALRPEVPGVSLPGVLTVRDLADARRLDALLRSRAAGGRALLVGGGAIGVELAEALLARGIEVDLVELLPRAVPALAAEPGELVAAEMARAGVSIRTGAGLERIDAAGERLAATVAGARSEYDLVVLGTGVAPNAELAASAGCELGERGAIAVDRRGRTSVAGIWAAGDCATAHHRVLERPVWIPLATTANAQGRVAGRDAAGAGGRFAGVLGSWVSKFGEVAFGATGIDVDAAREAGFAPRAVVRDGRGRSGYMPGAGRVRVRLVWDEPTGRLLGGQIAGAGAVSSRLHVVSTAISAGMTIRELAECDFGYAPPVTPLRDPVELAAAAAIGDAP